MKHIFLSCILFSIPLHAQTESYEIRQLKSFASEILEAHQSDGDPISDINSRYRTILTQHSNSLFAIVQNANFAQSLKEDPRLHSLFAGANFSLLSSLYPMLTIFGVPSLPSISLLPNISSLLSDEILKKFDDAINSSVQQFKFSKTTAISLLVDPESGMDLSQAPEVLQKFLKLVLDRYFDALDVWTKRAILADVLKIDKDAPAEEVLIVILNHCGPVLQKAFQLFSKDVHSPKLVLVLNQLRQNIKAFPTALAKDIIEKEAKISIRTEFPTFPDKPIAAATIGQVYLAETWTKKKLIIKVQRPDIEKKAESEFILLRSLTKDPSVLNFIKGLQESFSAEVSFDTERKHLREGQVYNGKMNGKLSVINESPLYKSTSKVLFLTVAEGKSIEKFGVEASDQKKEALRQLLYTWLEEAFFGTQIFHADLHPGNVFLALDENDASKFKLTLIDFGSVGSLTHQEAKALFKIIIGIYMEKSSLVFRGLQDVSQWKDGVTDENVQDLVNTIMQADFLASEKIRILFNKALELGILLPTSFVQFYRGEAFIENQIYETLQDDLGMEEGTTEAAILVKSVYSSVFKWNLIWDFCLTATGVQDDCAAFIDNEVLFTWLRGD